MKFDEHGHFSWSPKQIFQLAIDSPRKLVNHYLMAGTPKAFATHASYCEFLEAIAERTGVHPRNLFLRGSCHIGFSIAPKQTAWSAMRCEPDPSDLDLVVVDEAYFTRFEREVQWWEDRNPSDVLQGQARTAFIRRQQDRQFSCCRDEALPSTICVHHRDAMTAVAAMKHCEIYRPLSAFVYPDWLSARVRYEYDLKLLISGVSRKELPEPGDEPIP